jgi:hypothetical protein
MTDDCGIVVSDRRLTRIKGVVIDPYAEDAVKSICVGCLDAHFTVSYTGLAEEEAGRGLRTDRWLLEELIDMKAGERPLQHVLNDLKVRAERRFRALQHLGESRAITLVLSGFINKKRIFIATLSNYEDPSGRRLSRVSDEFITVTHTRTPNDSVGYAVLFHGAEDAVEEAVWLAVGKMMKRFLRVEPTRKTAMVLDVMQRAASNSRYGKYIGRDYQSVIVLPNSSFEARYHPEQAGEITYAPHFVAPGVAYRDSVFVGGGEITLMG